MTIRPAVFAAVLLTGCARESPKPLDPVYFKVDAATAGALKGTAHIAGKTPAAKTLSLDQDPECVRAHGKMQRSDESIVTGPGGALANAFIYIASGLEGKAFAPPSSPAVIDQKGCWFRPRVLGIQTGQSLSVTNSDPLTHNIHPMAQLNREWNQSQAEGDPPLQRRFTRQEIMVPVKCNIHGWMRSFIGVVDHPYFAVTSADGTFEIRNVPPGSYTIAAWHERLGTQRQSVTVAPSATVLSKFTFKGD